MALFRILAALWLFSFGAMAITYAWFIWRGDREDAEQDAELEHLWDLPATEPERRQML